MSRKTAEFARDLQAGLSTLQIPDFDELQTVGMATTLAIHIKDLGEIDYDILRKVSDHFMGIPSYALKPTLQMLEEIGFVDLITTGKTIRKIIPRIPTFEDVYSSIGDYASSELTFNSFEQATIEILDRLHASPYNKQKLLNDTNIDNDLFKRCLETGVKSGIVSQHKARGRDIILSPFYFGDNLKGLADVAASCGASALQSTISKIQNNQGWPLSLVHKHSEIGGYKLNSTELSLVDRLSSEGIIKPPRLDFGGKHEHFIFTPKPGRVRLNAANREIYERAMACISSVRKGQLLADQYKIQSPARILEVLRDRGYLKSNSEAKNQYHNLVILKVAYLKQVSTGRWQLHLNQTSENVQALDLAIKLLRTGQLADMEVDQEARIALTKDEEYVQSLISSTELRRREKQISDPQAQEEFEQMLLKFE